MAEERGLKLLGIDHIEFAVADADKASEVYLLLGFENAGTREIRERGLRSHLLVQNGIRVVISQSQEPGDPVARFVAAHGDGLLSVGLLCDDALSALETASRRGAEVCSAPKSNQKDFGEVQQAVIRGFGDIRHTFVSRKGDLFAEGFDIPLTTPPAGAGLEHIDHIAANVDAGTLDQWTDFYERVLGLRAGTPEPFEGGRRRLLGSGDGMLRLVLNEPAEPPSDIARFLEINHGPGISHVAFATKDIVASATALRGAGLELLPVPHSHYLPLRERYPDLGPSVEQLRELSVLVEATESGHLLQAFTAPVLGPFFYELIQRNGHPGIGREFPLL